VPLKEKLCVVLAQTTPDLGSKTTVGSFLIHGEDEGCDDIPKLMWHIGSSKRVDRVTSEMVDMRPEGCSITTFGSRYCQF